MRASRSASSRNMRRLAALLFTLSTCLLCLYSPGSFHAAHAQQEGRYYSETGYTLAPQFVALYDTHGGLALFGYPVTEAHIENGYLVQWTERQRFEYHPENKGTDYEVLLGLLGREMTYGHTGPNFRPQQQQASSSGPAPLNSGGQAQRLGSTYYFQPTGQTVAEPFLSYWRERGGLPVFGYPISTVYTDDKGLLVQWFERARFEYHPENDEPNQVLLGHLGLEALKEQEKPLYEMQVSDTPAPANPLQIGIAQGGESDDPSFFDNVLGQGRDLGPGMVRLDNIFSFYGIVQRGADGTVTYSWDKFDRVLDSIKAMGKEPLLCLSYMPETMSLSGSSRVEPPKSYDEWAALVSATVRHVNVERGLGVRYWEVWNEPDLDGFWRAPFEEYMHLYDVTVDAALKADPNILIGGPAFANFSHDGLGEFLQHETDLGDKGRADFISWHSYGRSPEQLAADIREARSIAAQFPRFHPELLITEFNVLQGGPGDTSANHATDTVDGAIAFLSSIESMQRERLDKAFLFELKDGAGPQSYWGRWGMLTNDGQPKPSYYAYKAFQTRPAGQLPVSLKRGPEDGSLGLLAFGSGSRSTLLLWYTGAAAARVRLAMPHSFDGTTYDVALFDSATNNPARTGNSSLKLSAPLNAGDLVFDLKPGSLLILTSR